MKDKFREALMEEHITEILDYFSFEKLGCLVIYEKHGDNNLYMQANQPIKNVQEMIEYIEKYIKNNFDKIKAMYDEK